jgi:L-alanine-DL-glutamate epimerase-like enolase superfamily enzyme
MQVLQTDINHVGGIVGLGKVSQMAAVSGISMALTPAKGGLAVWPLCTFPGERRRFDKWPADLDIQVAGTSMARVSTTMVR